MTNVNVTAIRINPMGGSTQKGWREGFIDSAAKAAQNDTWTVKNAKEVIWAVATVDATGAADAVTLSTNVITLTSATSGTARSAYIIYR